MAKKAKAKQIKGLLSPRARAVVLPLFLVIGVGVVILTVISIIVMPNMKPGTQYGVGADGFRAFVEEKGDLEIGSAVSKDSVVAALGDKATSVGERDISKVFNYNGDRSQTVTYPFVRKDGVAANLFIDMKIYKSSQAMEKDNLYVMTADAGKINGYPAYFKHAQTIGTDREYHLLIINGTTAYRFVVAQPYNNITISEVGAVAALKKLAQGMRL